MIDCGIDDADAALLAQNPNIAILSLPWNQITAVGARAISHSQASDINLMRNRVTGEGLEALATSNTLGILDIRGNPINGRGISALLKNKKLSTLIYTNIKEEFEQTEKEAVLFAAQHSNLTQVEILEAEDRYPWQEKFYPDSNNIEHAANGPDFEMLREKILENQSRAAALIHACKNDSLDSARNLLTDPNSPVLPYGAWINNRLSGGGNLLHKLAVEGSKAMLDLLLKHMPRSEHYMKDHAGLTYYEAALEKNVNKREYTPYIGFKLSVSEHKNHFSGWLHVHNADADNPPVAGNHAESSRMAENRSQQVVPINTMRPVFFLVVLNLIKQPIDSNAAATIASLESLRFLYLNHCGINNDSAAYLLEKTKASVIDLSYNDLGYDGIAPVPKNPHIFSLNLYKNHIGDDAAVLLGDDPNLTYVNFGANGITDRGAIPFGSKTRASHVDLSQNMITNHSMAGFAANKFITTLLLNDNLIGNDGFTQLLGNLLLSTVGVARNPIGRKSTTMVPNNPSLTELWMRNEPTTSPKGNLQVKRQDERTLYSRIAWTISHCTNRITNYQYNLAQRHIEQNQKRARVIVDKCIALILCKNSDESAALYRDLRISLSHTQVKTNPYGSYISRYSRESGYSGNLLHVAVRGQHIELLRLLLQYMPRHAYYEQNSEGLTYEGLAVKTGFTLPDDLKSSVWIYRISRTETEEHEYHNMIFTVLKKSYFKAWTNSNGALYSVGPRQTLAQGAMQAVSDIPIPVISDIASATNKSIRAATEILTQRESHNLIEWLSDETVVRLLADYMRTFYLRANHSYGFGNTSSWNEINEDFDRKYHQLISGKTYSRTEYLAITHANKLCDYMCENPRPKEKTPNQCFDEMSTAIFWRSHQKINAQRLNQHGSHFVPATQHPQSTQQEAALLPSPILAQEIEPTPAPTVLTPLEESRLNMSVKAQNIDNHVLEHHTRANVITEVMHTQARLTTVLYEPPGVLPTNIPTQDPDAKDKSTAYLDLIL